MKIILFVCAIVFSYQVFANEHLKTFVDVQIELTKASIKTHSQRKKDEVFKGYHCFELGENKAALLRSIFDERDYEGYMHSVARQTVGEWFPDICFDERTQGTKKDLIKDLKSYLTVLKKVKKSIEDDHHVDG